MITGLIGPASLASASGGGAGAGGGGGGDNLAQATGHPLLVVTVTLDPGFDPNCGSTLYAIALKSSPGKAQVQFKNKLASQVVVQYANRSSPAGAQTAGPSKTVASRLDFTRAGQYVASCKVGGRTYQSLRYGVLVK